MNEKLKQEFENHINIIIESERASPSDIASLSLGLFLIIREQDEKLSKLREVVESRTGPIYG